jgi:hypothetical protein
MNKRRRQSSSDRVEARGLISRAARRGAALVVAVVTVGGLGASGTACSSSSSSDECLSNREFFAQQVWSGFMGQKCAKCHTPDGTAVADSNAKFVLQRETYPGFIDANLENIAEIAKIDFEGQAELLAKPLGKAKHGGGAILTEGDDDYKVLAELVDRVKSGESCTPAPDTTLQSIAIAQGPNTLRRAALDLVSRLPTQAESDAVKKGGDKALDAALDAMMKEDAFYDRVREIFNDTLLTDRWLSYGGAAIDFMNVETDYPGLKPYRDQNDPAYSSDARPLVNKAIAREPLDLIAYVVKNDKPFTDIVGANYTVVNPFTAIAYGATGVTFKDDTDYNEFHEVKVKLGTGVDYPHAGVLSMPSFLNRWPTTQTNKSRGRARRVAAFFLATDVLKIAMRPVDVTKLSTTENPTRNSSACTVCHKVMEPISGAFRGFGEGDYEDFDPTRPWHDDMFPPGFGAEVMDASYYSHALQWLGPKIGNDPRFAISTVRTVYKGLTGRDPIPYPNDSQDPDFHTKLRAWEAQDNFIRSTADAFVAKGNAYNVKAVFKAIIKSPYYRAVDAPTTVDKGALVDIGLGRLLTPEMLNRKISAVTGVHWRKGWDWKNQHDWLREDYDILYGGIDSESTITRLTLANGLIASVAGRMANEVSCSVTAWDFTSAAAQRRFFPYVELTEMPESAGHTVDGSVSDIKKNIQYLHKLLLDEDLAVTDPEITRTYQLFLDTWHELSQAGDDGVEWACQGRSNPIDGSDLPDAVQIGDDKNFTLRSWQAVMTYLMADYKFLYE